MNFMAILLLVICWIYTCPVSMGRCSHADNLRLNSGVVVVQDNATAKKVPRIPGLLEYRQDQKKNFQPPEVRPIPDSPNLQVIGKLIKLEEYMDSKLKELKGKIQATDAELKGKIANVEATNINFQRKIDTKYTELEGKIDAGDAELKRNLSISIPDYYKQLVEVGKKYPGCIKYQWLTDSDRRYDFSSSSSQKCDDNLQGWYRFGGGAGTRMITNCHFQTYYACNAYYSGYMSGSHPSVNEGIVTRTVYFFYPNSCGNYGRSIKVINCAGLYYVYQINNGVPGCSGRYCSTN